VTIPFDQTFEPEEKFEKFREGQPPVVQEDLLQKKKDILKMCGCGWPQHMLVPRGTLNGFPVVFFVMITDYEQDEVSQKGSLS